MYQMTAHIHIKTGEGGKRLITPRYTASVAGKDKAARMNLTLGL